MIGTLLRPEFEALVRDRAFPQLREILLGFHPADAAELLADLTAADTAVLLRILPREFAADVFERLPLVDQERLVRALGDDDTAAILEQVPADVRTALFEELPAPLARRLLEQLEPAKRRQALELLGYPKDSVGRRMTPDCVAIEEGWYVEEVLAHLRRVGADREGMTLNQLYLVDASGRLRDWVRLQRVVVSPATTPVAQLREGRDLSLRASDPIAKAVAAFRRYEVTILPVTDPNGVLLGVVTVDDILDLAESESTRDIQQLGGMESLDEPYLRIALGRMVRKRAGWLALLFLGEMLTATAMGFFEGEIARAVVLASFIPLIISSGGNSGSQSTSLMIRSLAVGDVSLRDAWRVLRRELLVSTALGLTLAALGFARISLWQAFGFHDYGHHHFLIAATVGLSLVCVVLFGGLAGAMLPFVLRRLRVDPAVASAPLVATLVDVTGLVIYFSVAYLVLHGTLL